MERLSKLFATTMLKRNARKIYLGLAVAVILITSLAFSSIDFQTSKSLDIFFSFFRELSIFYVDKPDTEKLINIGIEAILESLDPYNEFISEDNIEALEFQTTGEYGGMGALIRHNPNFPVIAEIYEGSPAHKAGLMAGDYILQVNEHSVSSTSVDKVSKMLKGAPKSTLKVIVKRQNSSDSLTFIFKRERIHVPSVPYYGRLSTDIGYIKLGNFTSNCDKEVERALKELKSDKQLKGLILDLRGNPGGLLLEAVKIVNIFVDKNQLVVFTKGQIQDFYQEHKTLSRAVDTEIPLVVLVDRISASASEIVAGALQDLDRAVIIGERTFGKGLVQATRPLPYNAQLKITTAKYYIPSGRCIQAVDFTQRNEDGSISYIPDSLINEFKTRNGRIVLDGGGITPDVNHKPTIYSRLASVLYARNLFFDYATLFRLANPTIDDPKKFSLSKNYYNDFVDFIKSADFQYQSQTELMLREMIKTAKQEKYYELSQNHIDSLLAVVARNRLKDLNILETEIKKLLEEEIVSRYHYQRGKAEYNIYGDSIIPPCIELLNNNESYKKILLGTSTNSSTASRIFTKPIMRSINRGVETTKTIASSNEKLFPS
jgi:carboxyl-terminal processing protease